MATKKAGCILVNTKTKKIGLIYRKFQDDISFAKGHVEDGETFEECAVRETAEETKRDSVIDKSAGEYIETYTTPRGEMCENHMFVSIDTGASSNDSPEVHDLIWVDYDDVESKLSTRSYKSVVETWKYFKSFIFNLLKKG